MPKVQHENVGLVQSPLYAFEEGELLCPMAHSSRPAGSLPLPVLLWNDPFHPPGLGEDGMCEQMRHLWENHVLEVCEVMYAVLTWTFSLKKKSYLRERELEGGAKGGRERERERERENPKQAPSYEHRAQRGARTHES